MSAAASSDDTPVAPNNVEIEKLDTKREFVKDLLDAAPKDRKKMCLTRKDIKGLKALNTEQLIHPMIH